MKSEVSVLKGWRLKLFNKLLDDGLFEIKNNKLVATDKGVKFFTKKQ